MRRPDRSDAAPVAHPKRASRRGAARSPTHRAQAHSTRRNKTKRSLLRRIARLVWVSPRHAALAFTTGLVCGAFASRGSAVIAPAYAAILGAIVLYPAMILVWQRMRRTR